MDKHAWFGCKTVFVLLILAVCNAGYARASLPNGRIQTFFEEWRLPDEEHTGMAEVAVSHRFTEYFSGGFGSWMAVTGKRGGFITLGLEGNLCIPLSERLFFDTGLFIGAGGGRGGYLLSGGGLMLRTFAGMSYQAASWGKLGAGISYVDFPEGGTIHSTQPFFYCSVPFTSFTQSGWSSKSISLSDSQFFWILPKKHSLALVSRYLQVPSALLNDTGGRQHDVTLFGVEWLTQMSNNWYVKLETEGAAGGQSAGYMQILAGTGYRVPLSENIFVNNDISTGAGGGGGVDSGGGLLFDVSSGVQWYFSNLFFAELSAAHILAGTGSFAANSLSLKVGYKPDAALDVTGLNNIYRPVCMRVRAVTQSYFQASKKWRSHHVDQHVDNLGLQVDYFINPYWYATGQGLAAYRGNAGAYMTGLVGSGVRINLFKALHGNVEALVGAAGGGGLTMGSGLVWQGNAGIGYDIDPSLSVMVAGGRMHAFNGAFRANVVSASLAWQLTSYQKK